MDKLDILGIPIDAVNKQETVTDNTVDTEELAHAIILGCAEAEDIKAELLSLDETCRAYHNLTIIADAYKKYPEDKGLEAICSSEEAWALTDTLKKTLTKFKDFFKKVFEYITNFVVLRVKSAASQIEKWETILGDPQKDQNKLNKIAKEYEAKDCSTESIKIALELAVQAYYEISKQVGLAKGVAPTADQAAIEKALTKSSDIEIYKKFMEAYDAFEKMIPDEKNPATQTASKSAQDGKWFEAGPVGQVKKSVTGVTSALINIKRLQAECNAVVASLEKTSTNPDDNLKNINNQKIEWLRDMSKTILSGMIVKITKLTSRAAAKCQTLCNMYNK